MNAYKILSDVRVSALSSRKPLPGYDNNDDSLVHTGDCCSNIFEDDLGQIVNTKESKVMGVAYRCVWKQFISRCEDKDMFYFSPIHQEGL